MKKNLSIALLTMMMLLTQFGFASAQGKTPPDSLTSDEMGNAILIVDPNIRPLVLAPGDSVLYRVDGTNLYIKAANLSSPDDKSTILPLAIWSKTQVCGIHVYVNGLPVAFSKPSQRHLLHKYC